METILAGIKENYDMSDVKIGEILQNKGGRIVAMIFSGDKKYIVKITDTSKSKEDVERDVSVFSFLKQNGFANISELVKTKSNQSYIAIDNQFVYVLEYIKGKSPENTIESWSVLGELVAKLHKIDNYSHKTSFTFENEKPSLIEKANEYIFKNEYLELVNNLPNFDALPQFLIHTDIGPHNSIQKEDGTIVLIDWDDCGVGARVLDLGFPLICQFLNSELVFDKDKASAFYKTYIKNNPITQEEKKVFFDAGLFFSLLYLPYGNVERNWEKIKYAIQNRKFIERGLDQDLKITNF